MDIMSIVAQFDLELEQMDVKIMFLHSDWKRRYTWSNLKVTIRKVKKTKFIF